MKQDFVNNEEGTETKEGNEFDKKFFKNHNISYMQEGGEGIMLHQSLSKELKIKYEKEFNEHMEFEFEKLKKEMEALNTHAVKFVEKMEELNSTNKSDPTLSHAKTSFLAISSIVSDAGNKIEYAYNKFKEEENTFKEATEALNTKEKQQETFRSSKEAYLSNKEKGDNSKHEHTNR